MQRNKKRNHPVSFLFYVLLQLFFTFGQCQERIDQIFYIHFINQTAVPF